MGNDIETSELLCSAAFLPLFQITHDKDTAFWGKPKIINIFVFIIKKKSNERD
jgi:hypothetical protein